ncbi:pentapeptide repeat-containing protein [Flagellimonas sp. HMM57]|uniref:pentapeptide repeat-containing protein n=1 Tax=unclassified Flagellimonas TaxID=2644544 RepID=UPI0013D1CF82|nr:MULTISPECIES: pentapeptide repeat-containing protein [unclassified Flagellimonas]UII77334.1 pentapeptide repeat-containing protein [Flagellimonas sp. HMM57]
MKDSFIADQEFVGIDYTKNRLPKADYENCIFTNCTFTNAYLDNQNFMECEFVACDLTNANISHTTFKESLFKDSKLIGLRFEDCNEFLLSVQFDNCNLHLTSFYQVGLKGTLFSGCSLLETDFTGTDLTSAKLQNCNLEKAIFFQTILEGADLSTSFNYTIDPEKNQLKKAKFSKNGLSGLLKKYEIKIV